MANSPEVRLIAHTLAALSHSELMTMANAMCKEAVKPSSDKVQLVVLILKASGYSYAEVEDAGKSVKTAPKVLTIEQVNHLLLTYVDDEIMLLEATASMLRTIATVARERGATTSTTQALARDSVAECQRLMAHSNLTRLVHLLKSLYPRQGELSR